MIWFTMEELTRSDTAKRLRITNMPGSRECRMLHALVNNLLDPLREYMGIPIRVTSGYRSAALYMRIGGVPNSQHVEGKAADVTTGSREGNIELVEAVLTMFDGLYDQMIVYEDFKWIHLSFDWERYERGEDQRGDYLVKEGKRYVFKMKNRPKNQ